MSKALSNQFLLALFVVSLGFGSGTQLSLAAGTVEFIEAANSAEDEAEAASFDRGGINFAVEGTTEMTEEYRSGITSSLMGAFGDTAADVRVFFRQKQQANTDLVAYIDGYRFNHITFDGYGDFYAFLRREWLAATAGQNHDGHVSRILVMSDVFERLSERFGCNGDENCEEVLNGPVMYVYRDGGFFPVFVIFQYAADHYVTAKVCPELARAYVLVELDKFFKEDLSPQLQKSSFGVAELSNCTSVRYVIDDSVVFFQQTSHDAVVDALYVSIEHAASNLLEFNKNVHISSWVDSLSDEEVNEIVEEIERCLNSGADDC